MLMEYETISRSIVEAISKEDYVLVDKLLDERKNLIATIESSNGLSGFRREYVGSSAYKLDLDIEFMLEHSKELLCKEIEDLNNSKKCNMAYINTFKDDMSIFVAKV